MSADDNSFHKQIFWLCQVVNNKRVWVHVAAYSLTPSTCIWFRVNDLIDSIHKQT